AVETHHDRAAPGLALGTEALDVGRGHDATRDGKVEANEFGSQAALQVPDALDAGIAEVRGTGNLPEDRVAQLHVLDQRRQNLHRGRESPPLPQLHLHGSGASAAAIEMQEADEAERVLTAAPERVLDVR